MTSSSSPSDPLHGLNPELLLDLVAESPGLADTAPQARPDLPSLGEVARAFPDLEVQVLIGHGGMSAVFRARQPRLGRVVALKVLPKSLAAIPGFAERFTREGQVLARLSHPHIVTVHDFGERDGFWFLIMEHVDGVNLRQAMRAGRFTPEQALQMIPAICDALQFAHGQGVLHRDIKPENILLDAKGGIKIADFGIAKILGEEAEGGMLLTQSGAKLGTAPYMAPEQIEKPASVDHRADIYSLGVVFYEMLTGELPLGRFAAPSELAGVGGGMDAVVLRALEKERARRQQSAEEFKTQVAGAGSRPRSRRSYQWGEPFEYKSKRKLCGLPLLHVVHGRDPKTGGVRTAKGFFAFGDKARGVFAFGSMAYGFFAFGGLATGVVAFGGAAFGLISMGGLALGLLFASGGFSIGTLAVGGFALGYHAYGGIVAGWYGAGGQVFAHHGYGGQVTATHVVTNLQFMPPLTNRLASFTPYTSALSILTGLIWLPLGVLTSVVHYWARMQTSIDAGEPAPEQKAASVFWLLPFLTGACGVFCLVMYRIFTVEGTSLTMHIVPGLVTSAGLVMLLAAVPLWMRLVPMNSLYGLRLASTMISDDRWYEANAYLGKKLCAWSVPVLAAGVAGFYQLPRHQDDYAWAALALTLTAVAAVVVSVVFWLRHHPVEGPATKPSRWFKYAGQALTALVLAFFIKGFILEMYRMAGRAEVGVTQGSHWIASKLDTGFKPNDLVVFEHASGYPYVGRVVKREDKGLLLKRGGVAEEFFVDWDKVIGKLWFSHFTPDAVKAAGGAEDRNPTPEPPIEGTAKALTRKPELRFVRMRRKNQSWQQAFTPAGQVFPEKEDPEFPWSSIVSEDGNPEHQEMVWLQFAFEHPDFDPLCDLAITVMNPNSETVPFDACSVGIHPSISTFSVNASFRHRGKLPEIADVVLRYSIGRWQVLMRVDPGTRSPEVLGNGCVITSMGDNSEHQAFLTWSFQGPASHLFDAVAVLKNGQRIRSSGKDRVMLPAKEGSVMETLSFPLPLREIRVFEVRSRPILTKVYEDVVIPLLP